MHRCPEVVCSVGADGLGRWVGRFDPRGDDRTGPAGRSVRACCGLAWTCVHRYSHRQRPCVGWPRYRAEHPEPDQRYGLVCRLRVTLSAGRFACPFRVVVLGPLRACLGAESFSCCPCLWPAVRLVRPGAGSQSWPQGCCVQLQNECWLGTQADSVGGSRPCQVSPAGSGRVLGRTGRGRWLASALSWRPSSESH